MRLTLHNAVAIFGKAQQEDEMASEIKEFGALAARVTALVRVLLGYGHLLSAAEAAHVLGEVEAGSWQRWEGKRTGWAEALWPCGHVQTVDLGGGVAEWIPRPTHWRPLYVPPSLVVGGRAKPLIGSVVGGKRGAMSVQVDPK